MLPPSPPPHTHPKEHFLPLLRNLRVCALGVSSKWAMLRGWVTLVCFQACRCHGMFGCTVNFQVPELWNSPKVLMMLPQLLVLKNLVLVQHVSEVSWKGEPRLHVCVTTIRNSFLELHNSCRWWAALKSMAASSIYDLCLAPLTTYLTLHTPCHSIFYFRGKGGVPLGLLLTAGRGHFFKSTIITPWKLNYKSIPGSWCCTTNFMTNFEIWSSKVRAARSSKGFLFAIWSLSW